MSVAKGTRLGAYEILALIGAGGMGEVYRARDSRLNRDVAIKVLPDTFASDPERLARFTREAQTLAALNHPNIAHIHGFEESGGVRALVMELVDGDDLAQRIARGAIPLDEALPIAKQIAEALEAAHEAGIIHRDLKPANIKVRPDGTVKVLDFGLAKAFAPDVASATADNLSQSPTITTPAATLMGMILGTASYMSPEQAKGKPVDKRTDIWAFGCVLYEMLTGKRTFGGDDVTDTIAAVVRAEPDWGVLPGNTPPKIRHLLARCLTKDPSRRLRDIGDGRIDIEEAGRGAAEPTPETPARARLAWAVATTAVLIAVAAVLSGRKREDSSYASTSPPMRFSISPPQGWRFLEAPIADGMAISPDGKRLAFGVASEAGDLRIAVRAVDSLAAELVPGTVSSGPFWSPDSRYLGFAAGGKLKRIELSSGVVQVICDAPSFQWATWGNSETIVFSMNGTPGLFRVPAMGGEPQQITALDQSRGEIGHAYPQFLGDGRHFLYSVFRPPEQMPVNLGNLDSKDIKHISSSDSAVQYAAGYLFFMRGGKLMAQRFDERKLDLEGEAIRLVESVWVNPVNNYPAYGVSSELVAFEAGNVPETQLVWVDRTGKDIGTIGTRDRYIAVSLSPRETDAAVMRFDSQSRNFDIWTIDIKSGSPSRFTFEPLFETFPVWSPNGDSIAFSDITGEIKAKPANGSTQAETISKTNNGLGALASWSKDGRYIAYTTDQLAGGDVGILPISGDKKPVLLLHERFEENNPRISPDSKWMAYEANESGRSEIYVVSFPKPEGKWQISATGGTKPKWRGDGKELFFLSPSSQLMAVDVNSEGATFQKGVPKPLFRLPGPRSPSSVFYNYDVAQNGQRFLLNKVLESSEPPTITVISNWQALLK